MTFKTTATVVCATVLCAFTTLALGFPGLASAAESYKIQADAETKAGRAACEKFKKDFAPLEAEKRVKGQKVLKQTSDVEKAIALIEAKEVSSAKRNELREGFFKNPKPTRTDVGSFIAVDSSNCMFPVFSAIARTVETAGTATDAKLKEKTRAMLKRWFETNEKNVENIISVAMTRILFERALAGGVIKGGKEDEAFLKEIAQTVRTKSEESAKNFSSQADGLSDAEVEKKTGADLKKVENKEFEDFKFDPAKMQGYLVAERNTAKELSTRLKTWFAQH